MKNSLLIDSNLSNNIWVKAIETTNYLPNQLFIKTESYKKFIPKEN